MLTADPQEYVPDAQGHEDIAPSLPTPSPGVPHTSNPALPRDPPPALAAGGHTELEKRDDEEFINWSRESEFFFFPC